MARFGNIVLALIIILSLTGAIRAVNEEECPAAAPRSRTQSDTASLKTARLIVTVPGLRNHSGKVSALLFSGPDGFPNDAKKAVANQTVVIVEDSVTITFDNLAPGEYACVLLHDENDNGKMDTSFGFPLEGFGTSNNPKVRMGPPRFKEAKFSITGDTPEHRMTIHPVYLSREGNNRQ